VGVVTFAGVQAETAHGFFKLVEGLTAEGAVAGTVLVVVVVVAVVVTAVSPAAVVGHCGELECGFQVSLMI
jgi:hypothetical protein